MTTNEVLDALGDPTRRALCDLLAAGPLPVGQLAAHVPVSRPAVSQHLKVLKNAGLVIDRPEGNRRVYALDPSGVAVLRDWLDRVWTDALGAFKTAMEQATSGGNMISTDTTFRTSVTVKGAPDAAFRLFTAGFDSWWPRGHHIGTAEMAEAVMEPFVGGRWHERGVDGSECDWGTVLVWEPPRHVAVTWHLNGAFRYDPDPDKASRVDVRFLAESDGTTRVELEHSGLDRHGDGWTDVRDGISSDGGWRDLLAKFAATADS